MHKRKLKKPVLIILMFLIICVIGGGIFGVTKLVNKNKDVENPKQTLNEKKEETKKVEPTVQIVDLNTKSRPYAIMINNADAARRGHSGLQDAYMVYEIIVEGGITRYLALFLDQNTERIGSVRSARHYYLDYALENDAIYIHHGKSPQAQSDFYSLKNLDRVEISDPYSGFRDNTMGVAWEHRLFTSIELLNKVSSNKRKERNNDLLLKYSAVNIDTANLNPEDATNIELKYSGYNKTSYVYDSDANVYKQFVNGNEHTDYVTKKQYTVKNIITYQVENYTLDDSENKGRQGLKNIGSGDGYLITGGKAIPITWKKDSRNAQTIYKYKATGEEIMVNDGNTWIHIVPTNGKVSIS